MASKKEQIIEMASSGEHTPSEIAAALGASRGYVSTTMRSAGLVPGNEIQRNVAEGRRKEDAARVEEFIKANPGCSVADVETFLDANYSYTRNVLAVVDPEVSRLVLTKPVLRGKEDFTEAQIKKALKRAVKDIAATRKSVTLDRNVYATWLKTQEEGSAPTVSVIVNKFGTWNRALAAADVDIPEATTQTTRKFTEETCIDAIRRFKSEVPGVKIGISEYDAWRNGNPNIPSSASIRVIVGGWNAARQMAIRSEG